MGARTCLLCGKPLSRIWAGTGEDFCSREHQNQYRLRRGMDRLLEANKVASVMRRRENPRQIPPGNLRSAGSDSPRGFFEPKPPRDLAESASFVPPTVEPILHQGLDRTNGWRRPQANAGWPQRDETPRPLPFVGKQAIAPRVPLALFAQVSEAPAARLRHKSTASSTRRLAAILPWRTARTAITTSLKDRTGRPDQGAVHGANPRKDVARPSKGLALRVSLAAGFRIPEWKLRIVVAKPEIAGMTWPEARELTVVAAAKPAPAKEARIAIEEPGMRIPHAPPADFQGNFRWPGIISVQIQFVNAANERRAASVPFGYPDEFVAKERR